ncbi:Cell wall proline rich protein [Lasiodiplodia theobromae]|uniref:Cell wall proline rich protein n=1 Tax=Lasiodiplodia theobromae TaxID=45133 RepID=UPI0015C2E44C|nr:Cell wall proline rich protein [Lasiodiplodia theobromae]KAF4538646.1 Cell wall proline rich protein [Lasiodiplodia theobromae]
MAQIALPRQPVTQAPASDMGAPLYQRADHIELVPNPHFVFPQPSPDSPPSDDPRPSGRRPSSLQVLPTARRTNPDFSKRRSASALPDFSFNPGQPSLTPAPSTTTPPHTPTSNSPSTPSKNIGHRRGASEFIGGGSFRSGTMVPMSSSPTKIEGGFPPQNSTLKLGPPAGRRGHAHRRSGAISSHDLSFLLQPSTNTPPNVPDIPRIDNTPATPIEKELKPSPFPKTQTPPPAINVFDSSSNPFQNASDFSQRPPSRARVGFSETVEYIRPLSTISSETESTMSTIRGHSVSNSLSSVVSGASSPSVARMARPNLTVTFDKENKSGRPSTAGAILDVKDTGKGSFGELLNSKRPRSAIFPEVQVSPPANSSPARHAKKRSFFWSEQRNSDSSISAASAVTTSEASVSVLSESPMSSPAEPSPSEIHMKAPPTPPRKSHKPRKVKSWATSIMGRKAKRHSSKLKEMPRRGSTPTLPSQSSFQDDDIEVDLDDLSPNFDDDNTVTIVTPTSNPVDARPRLDTNIASWQPKQMLGYEQDAMSPAIDLDAALGPFNTPTIGPVPPRAQARGMVARRKPMHSSMGIASGHRRTESAPELAPFEFRNTTTTAPTMADVFEEEEEEESEEEQAATSASGKSSSVVEASASEDEDETGTGIQVVETDQPQNGTTMTWNFSDAFSKSKSSFEYLAPSPMATGTIASVSPGTNPVDIARAPSPFQLSEEPEEPRTSSVTRSSDSTITPAGDGSREPEQTLNLPVPACTQAVQSPDSLSTSSFSPDFGRGQSSFDTARMGTAASSITDTRSMQMGEPGPECRVSVDDVPSLTSSRSTMTSAQHANFPYVMPRSPGDRVGSVSSMSSMPYDTRRKRTSIASLSRLVGSSFGERSKLSIEQRPQSEHADKPKDMKHKKTRRLSKMMQFWKNKHNLHS